MSTENFQLMVITILGVSLLFGGYKAIKRKSLTVGLGGGRGGGNPVLPMKIEGVIAQTMGILFIVSGIISLLALTLCILNIDYDINIVINIFIILLFSAYWGGIALQSIINLKEIIVNLLNKNNLFRK